MRETSESSDAPIEREGPESAIRQRRLKPEERDAIVREYNEESLTPHETDAILEKDKAESQVSASPDKTVKDCKGHAMTSVEGENLVDVTQDRRDSHFATIQMPEFNGTIIESYGQLESLISKRLPGLRHNSHFGEWMKQAYIYFEVMSIFVEKHPIEASAISKIARDKGISTYTIRKWISKGGLPLVFRYLNEASKNQQSARDIRERLGEFQSAERVRKKLKEIGMLESIDLWPTAEKQWISLSLFYQALLFLESGMLQCDIDRRLGLAATKTKRWVDGGLPWPVRIVVEPNSERSKIQFERLMVSIHEFKIDGIAVSSSHQLRALITGHYLGLAMRNDIDSLISDFEAYLALRAKLGERQTVMYSELSKMAEEIEVSVGKLRRWAIDGEIPRICLRIEQVALNKRLVAKFRERLPVQSMEQFSQLMNQLYIAPHLEEWSNYNDIEVYSAKYYRFLDMYESGMSQKTIAEMLEIDESTVYHWTRGRLSKALYLLQRFPRKQPRENRKWLPTRLDGRIFSDYIEVPDRISDYSEVIEVLRQLQMKPQDIMYVIGFTLSDGYIQLTSKTSFSLRSTLSQNYDWSKLILDDVSDSLSSLGPSRVLSIKRPDDDIWELANSSPLFVWIREVILGLGPDETKTYSPIKADWILTSSKQARIAFLQGLADGDGYASPAAQRVGIGSLVNRHLIRNLLKTLDINSVLHSKGVEIIRHEDIRRAAMLPLFKNATGRLESLSELCDMLDARPKSKRVTPNEIELILKLREHGMSYDQIGLHLWRYYGNSRNKSTIGRIIRQNQPESKKQS